MRMEKDRMTSELRTSMSNPRVSGVMSSRVAFGGADKKKIRDLEQLLESKHIDLALERKKLINEF